MPQIFCFQLLKCDDLNFYFDNKLNTKVIFDWEITTGISTVLNNCLIIWLSKCQKIVIQKQDTEMLISKL